MGYTLWLFHRYNVQYVDCEQAPVLFLDFTLYAILAKNSQGRGHTALGCYICLPASLYPYPFKGMDAL